MLERSPLEKPIICTSSILMRRSKFGTTMMNEAGISNESQSYQCPFSSDLLIFEYSEDRRCLMAFYVPYSTTTLYLVATAQNFLTRTYVGTYGKLEAWQDTCNLFCCRAECKTDLFVWLYDV